MIPIPVGGGGGGGGGGGQYCILNHGYVSRKFK